VQPFTGNGDVSIYVKNSCAGRKTINNKSMTGCWLSDFIVITPVRIRVRIDPPYPLVCCKATKWGCPSDETGKTEIHPCSKALSVQHLSLNFAAFHRQW
jgi:hypothetical protein